LESEGRVLMLRDGDDATYTLPTAARLGSADDDDSLLGRFRELGVESKITFLFAVYESESGQEHCVYYRGDIVRGPAESRSVSLFSFHEIPWDGIADSALRDMLARYVKERSENRFGIYVGDNEHGQVQELTENYFGSTGWS
jgi:hypothetical protein